MCVGQASVGPLGQSFWAVWDRERKLLHERTTVLRRGGVTVGEGFATVRTPGVRLEVILEEGAGVETVCAGAAGRGYVWTRKQGAVAAVATLTLGREPARTLRGCAVIDDTAGYHDRHTEWWWAAGVGHSRAGASVAWNLVSGVNDPPLHSERTIWVDSIPYEVGPVQFAADLSSIDFAGTAAAAGTDTDTDTDTEDDGQPVGLRFTAEAERRRREELVVVASDYRQPFGTFSGSMPVAGELRDGLGVTEHHRARW